MTNFIHHGNFSRSQYDMNEWYNPIKYGSSTTTLDLFDSFDELDTTIGIFYFIKLNYYNLFIYFLLNNQKVKTIIGLINLNLHNNIKVLEFHKSIES